METEVKSSYAAEEKKNGNAQYIRFPPKYRTEKLSEWG